MHVAQLNIKQTDHARSRKTKTTETQQPHPSLRRSSDVRILWKDNVAYRLLIKESLVIQGYEPFLNRATHSVPLLILPEGLERDLVPDSNG